MTPNGFFVKIGASAALLLSLILPATAARHIVTSAGDSVDGSLRAAIGLAAPGDTVRFDIQGTDTVLLKNTIQIDTDIVILGGANSATSNRVVVAADTPSAFKGSLFLIFGSSALVTIKGMVMTGARGQGAIYVNRAKKVILDSVDIYVNSGGGLVNYCKDDSVILSNSLVMGNSSGGIRNNAGALVAVNCTIIHNGAEAGGGGICNNDRMAVKGCVIHSNHAAGVGGGIDNERRGICAIEGCVIDSNTSISQASNGWGGSAIGGGIANYGLMSIGSTTIRHNESRGLGASYGWNGSSNGGGMYNAGGITMIGCVVDSNKSTGEAGDSWGGASSGGGIHNCGVFALINSIVWGNYSFAPCGDSYGGHSHGGGIDNDLGTLVMAHSLIGNNISAAENGNPHLGSDSGDDICNSAATCFMLNSIVLGDRVLVGRAVNTSTGGNIVGAKVRCIAGVSSWELFGVTVPALRDNGHGMLTIAIDSLSTARETGVRAGTYSRDTMISSFDDTCPTTKLAYYEGTQWLELETGKPVPAGTAVAAIAIDQCGRARGDPPSVGPVEYDAGMSAVRFATANGARTAAPVRFYINGNQCEIFFPAIGAYNVRLFTPQGRKVEEIANAAGARHVARLRVPASGAYIIAVTGRNGKTVRRIVVP